MDVRAAFTFTYSDKKESYELHSGRDSVRCRGREVELRSQVTVTLPALGMLYRFDDQPAASLRDCTCPARQWRNTEHSKAHVA